MLCIFLSVCMYTYFMYAYIFCILKQKELCFLSFSTKEHIWNKYIVTLKKCHNIIKVIKFSTNNPLKSQSELALNT